jgi:hypothetical protein
MFQTTCSNEETAKNGMGGGSLNGRAVTDPSRTEMISINIKGNVFRVHSSFSL